MQEELKYKDSIYQKRLLRIVTSSMMEKWLTNWLWYNIIQIKKKVNSATRWRLYQMMFVILWLHQKSLQADSSWFK